jgi:hypothetical protein
VYFDYLLEIDRFALPALQKSIAKQIRLQKYEKDKELQRCFQEKKAS